MWTDLGEVAHEMIPAIVLHRHDVKEKGIRVVVQRLMVQKELGKEAQVLRILPLLPPVDLVHRNVILPVNLIARWMGQVALAAVARERHRTPVVAHTELANQQPRTLRQLLRIRGKVPRCDAVFAEFDELDVFDTSDQVVGAVGGHAAGEPGNGQCARPLAHALAVARGNRRGGNGTENDIAIIVARGGGGLRGAL